MRVYLQGTTDYLQWCTPTTNSNTTTKEFLQKRVWLMLQEGKLQNSGSGGSIPLCFPPSPLPTPRKWVVFFFPFDFFLNSENSDFVFYFCERRANEL